MLDAIGISPIEEQAYRAVVRASSIAPDDLRAQLGLTLDQADVVFGSLAAKGLITSTAGPAKRLVAAQVEVAAEALLQRRLGELQAARLEFSHIAEEYHRTAGHGSIDEMIEIAPAAAVPTLFEQLQRQAKAEVWTITTPPYAVPADENSVELEQLGSGVSYLTLYTEAALDEPGALEMIQRYVEAGEQARMQPSVSLKMVVFDRETALVPIVAGPGVADLGDSLIVRPCSLLDALIELFDRLWMSAVPLEPLLSGPTVVGGATSGGRNISAQETRLLAMLLAGMTDDTVGRHLGVARRTVARRVHQLMVRAKATNRLQLILRAAQLGWIQVSDFPADGPRRSSERAPLTPPAAPSYGRSARRRTTAVAHPGEPSLAALDA